MEMEDKQYARIDSGGLFSTFCREAMVRDESFDEDGKRRNLCLYDLQMLMDGA
jgi:hypothetical protein